MSALLEQLWKMESRGCWRAVDLHFAALMTENMPQEHYERAYLVILWLSWQVSMGDICVELNDFYAQIAPFLHELDGITSDYLSELLNPNTIILQSLHHCSSVSDGSTITPLILENTRLYLYRMWHDENYIANYFLQRLHAAYPVPATLPSYLNQVFTSQEPLDWQKVAVALAVLHPVTIISGGPGTGKTTTVAKLLWTLLQLQPIGLRIVLAAPTGKAATRLTQSLQKAQQNLVLNVAQYQNFPQETITLHRLLGASDTERQFRYHQTNLLHLDVLVVDEASMIDLTLLAALLKALPPHAKLILLGDQDQLASVEAGSVLGDLCYFSRYPYSESCHQQLQQALNQTLSLPTLPHSGLADLLCVLRKSYRFDENSGIALLARAVNQGNIQQAWHNLTTPLVGLQQLPLTTQQDYCAMLQECVTGYRPFLTGLVMQSLEVSLQQLNTFQVITPLREGFYGVAGLNDQIQQALAAAGLIQLQATTPWYVGRPIMILRNNRQLGLYNGDIGITQRDRQGKLRVYFKLAQGEIKGFSPYRLPEHETAFALTIHKSQGSEFSHVLCVLPLEPHPLLTKELLYTAITRAQQQFTLAGRRSVFLQGMQHHIKRQSGLISKLTPKSHLE